MSSLETMIPSYKHYQLGGKELALAPVPILELKQKFLDSVQKSVIEGLKTASANVDVGSAMAPLMLVDHLIDSIDVAGLIFNMFDSVIDQRTGKKLNSDPELSKDWFKKYLTVPFIRQVVLDFVEVNEIEELIKNLQSLPLTGEAMIQLQKYGQMLLSFSPAPTGRTQ